MLNVTPSQNTAPPPGGAMRVVVLDDDPVFRVFLTRTLTAIGLEVVGQCSTIDAAKHRLARGDVDATTVDVVLKGESGLDFLKWCKGAHPGMVNVLVTAGSERGARTGADAVFLGAAALLTKPDARNIHGFEVEMRRVFADGRRKSAQTSGSAPAPARLGGATAPRTGASLRPALRRELLAIGASTGGPPVLLRLLKELPAAFDVPILITQHMPALHTPYMAELMAQQSGRRVRVATEGELVQKGTVYLAGNTRHLLVEKRATGWVLRLNDGPAEHFCKPAVDPMFRSIAQATQGGVLAVVVTGMGQDGARGAVALRARGIPVLVQDEATSVVWGMPGSVVAQGAADAVLPLERLASGICEWMAWPSRGGTRA